ncbi:MAG: DinB family protein [Planctomyces sp.]|nr:DinB family protein [Planctomyces sp.]
MSVEQLIQSYAEGAELLAKSIQNVTDDQLDLTPVPGKWSIRQVVCHLADFEPIYADRMKRVLVEDNPTLFGGDPDVFAAGLRYSKRCVREELELIRVVRSQMVRILKDMDVEDFQRTGVHSEAGPLTLETLLERITGHIPHHVKFIEEKIRLF